MPPAEHALRTDQRPALASRDTIMAARGIGIILVVFGHINPTGALVVNVYGFHMPLFFFLSGMTLRREPSLAGLAARDARSLLGYAALHFGLLALVTLAIFRPFGMNLAASSPLDWRTYLLWPFTRNSEHVHLFLIGWFLVSLFFVRSISVAILKLAWRLPPSLAILAAAGIAVVGARLAVHDFAAAFAGTKWWLWNLAAQIALGTAFCLAGHLAQNFTPVRLTRLVQDWRHPFLTALALYAALIVLQLSPFIMSLSQYPGGTIRTVLHAALGIAMVLILAEGLRGEDRLAGLGRDSKTIMTWHLTAMAALNLLFVVAGMLPAGGTGVFTVLSIGRLWPVYLLVGVMLPVSAKHAGIALRRLRHLRAATTPSNPPVA